ncbi:hypothetical protein [Anaerovorax odorimutans]|uniref:hypothetical protein n=1 Tax=Anaerovorax odorimutans TaxID=109327 RepID=UPI0003F4C32A|nr:hypothetical protein [Anaerovorax odorimutans]
MNNYFISLSPSKEDTAWYKAIADVEYFLNSIKFKSIPLKKCKKNMESCLKNNINCCNEDKIKNNGIILFQYPRARLEGLDLFKITEYIKSNYSGYKLTALVHDLDSIRYGNFFVTNALTEVNELNQFDYVIAVNNEMADLLKKQGVFSKILSLNIFDYVLSNKIDDFNSFKNYNIITVAYVGNLKYKKSPFIYQLDKVDLKNININIYGPWLSSEKFHPSENIKYIGSFFADDLANKVNADFGLCWDGDNLDKCEGQIGNYLRYTNLHKASFYLAMGMPIIISKDISTAKFIKDEQVGVLIDSVYDIPNVLNNISNEEYYFLKDNALRLSNRLKNGYFIKKVIHDIEKLITS